MEELCTQHTGINVKNSNQITLLYGRSEKREERQETTMLDTIDLLHSSVDEAEIEIPDDAFESSFMSHNVVSPVSKHFIWDF